MLSDIKNENLSRIRDQFYTQKEVAKSCVNLLSQHINLDNVIYLEPSAGTGAFLFALKNQKYIAYDIEPKHTDIRLCNFLEINEEKIAKDLSIENVHLYNIVTIGNPPFGKNANLAIKFFNHAATMSKVVAMILPATFEKDSVKKRLHNNMHLVMSIKLENDLFLLDEKLVKVPTVFQIWEKRVVNRQVIEKKKTSSYFDFVKREEANFAIQRVGAAAGKIKLNFAEVAQASHYFIKAEKEVLDAFKRIDWSSVKYNTAGNPSISKNEIVQLLEETMEKI